MLQSCFESSVNELLLRYKKRKWLLELESTPGKDDVKIAEMTTKYLEHYIILIYKAAAEFENIDSNFEKSTRDKMLSNSMHAPGKLFMKGSHSMQQTALLSHFKKLSQPLQSLATPTLLVNSHQNQQNLPQAKRWTH